MRALGASLGLEGPIWTYIGLRTQADQRIERLRPPDHCTEVESFWIGTP